MEEIVDDIDIDANELVVLDNMNVSDEIQKQKRYENSMNAGAKMFKKSLKMFERSPKMSENTANFTKQADIISLGSFEDDVEGGSVSSGRRRFSGRGKSAGRRRSLVSTPITEDWRKTTRSVTKNRCINYKVYNEIKHGTISDRNLV